MASHRFFHRPIYLMVCDELTERIARGEWKPGQAIPSEGDLARDLGVSPGTVRKALELLESSQTITRRQGRGSFVTDPSANRLADRFYAIRGADGEVLDARIEVTDVAQDTASPAEAARLQLEPDDLVWRLTRIRRDGDRAFLCERIALPSRLFPQVRADASNRIVALAHRCGLMLGSAEERLSVGPASPEAAAAFAVAPGTPVLLLDRVVRSTEGRPVEWRLAECHLGAGHYLALMSRGGRA